MTRPLPRIFLVVAFLAEALSAQRAPIPQQLVFTPYRASGIYDLGDTVGWTVTPGPVPPTYKYKWTVRRNNAVVLKEGTLDLSSGQASIEFVADQPEMIYVAIEAYEDLTPATPPPAGDTPRFVGGNTGRAWG